MRKAARFTGRWFAPMAVLAGMTGQATGQEAADERGASVVEVITVTAQKRTENIYDVPISVTAVSGDTLREQGVTDTSQLGRVVPGFVYQTSTFGAPIYYIRGIGFAEITQAVSPAVSIYVDQAPVPYSVMARGAILDLESVEALKGPQGTLFGQNSTGGAINYIAAKPTDEFTAGIDLDYGRFDTLQVGGFASGSISETLKFRLSARRENRSDWQKSSSRDDTNGQRDFTVGRLLLDWEASETLLFSLNVNGWRDKSDSQANQFIGYRFLVPCPPDGPGRPAACAALEAQPLSPENPRAADWTPGRSYAVDDDFYQVSLRGDWVASERLVFTSITSYTDYSSMAPFDTDGMAYENLTVIADIDIDSFNQELRADGTLDNGVAWMIGGSYQEGDSREDQLSVLGSTNSAAFDRLVSLNSQSVTSAAVFASIEVPVSDRLEVLLSARYTSEDRDFSGCAQDGGAGDLAGLLGVISNLRNGLPPVPPAFIEPGGCVTLDSVTSLPIGGRVFDTLSEDNVSWRASLSYKPQADSLAYFTASKGYKSGSYPLVPGVFDNQFEPATQESVLAYEVGLKRAFADQRVRMSSALYYYDYKDKQVRGFVDVGFPFGNVPAIVNIPESRAWGVEIELTAIPLEGLRISAAVNYIDTKVTKDFSIPDPLGDIINVRGETFPFAPEWQLGGDVEYRFPAGRALDVYIGISPSYRTSTKAAFGTNPILDVDGYVLLDLRVGIESTDGGWRLEAYGRNVTDEYYWTQATREIDAITRTAGLPATYGVRLNYRL